MQEGVKRGKSILLLVVGVLPVLRNIEELVEDVQVRHIIDFLQTTVTSMYNRVLYCIAPTDLSELLGLTPACSGR